MDFEEVNILFLKGVFLKDCTDVEDLFENELMETVELTKHQIEYKEPKIYDKIPQIFTTKENWVKKNNILCWYCNLDFQTMPIFIPENILKNDNGTYMEVFGNFCSFACAQTYIDTNIEYNSSKKKWEAQEFLKLLNRLLYGSKKDIIYKAPIKYIMEQYGGKKKSKCYKKEIMEIELKNK